MAKKDAIVAQMKEMVDREYAMGRQTTMSDTELAAMAERADADRYAKLCELMHGK